MLTANSHLVSCPICGTEYDPWLYDDCPRCEDVEAYEDEEDGYGVGGVEKND